ncbi:MAG: hypothetical protein IT456_20450 [Planctomycetes bacterium]|nr:hypothetical protein [Planctomycetota bacterium]
MNAPRNLFAASLLGLGIASLGSSLLAQVPQEPTVPQETIERLRRDQDEILRKAERLKALMERLQGRYEREHKEEAKLLQEGLLHLDRTGILRDVAGIRDDLAATAFSEALRKQRVVVDELERLLNILLERKSGEILDQQSKATAAQAKTARELAQRQKELQQDTAELLKTEPTAEEQALLDQLKELQQKQATEARENAQQAGTRRPFLENALQRVQELLRQQEKFEQGLADEAAGRTAQNRAQQFDLGSLAQRNRELASQLRGEAKQDELRKAAEALAKEAQGSDQQALQQAMDQLEAMTQNAPKLPGGTEGPARDPKWDALRDQLQKAPSGATPAERAELQKIAEAATALAEQRKQEAAARNAADAKRLQDEAQKLAERLQKGEAPANQAESASKTLGEAGKKLEEAQKASQEGNLAEAQRKVDQALAAIEQARQQDAKQHPDAEQQAGAMAAESAATAQELQNAPSAEAAERSASDQLRAAEQAQRQAEQKVSKARDAGQKPAAQAEAKASREQLEKARDTLEKALASATQDRSEDLQAAAERQQELAQQTAQQKQNLQQAAQSGKITPEQAKAASEQLDAAQQSMQQASDQLQKGQQSSASQKQQQAAQALQKAGEKLQENKATSEQQKQDLKAEAKKQEELAEDIVKLAEELKKRDNKAAQQAVEDAADAARKAKRAMEQGDTEETQQQQDEARQKLEEAQKELEEEADRYQDLRQEELLFKMKEELTTFLERQRPITAQTLEAQAQKEALSRPARKKLNQLSEEENELAGKIEFLVNALSEEGNLVYQMVLRANLEDLREVSRRLGGRSPDPSRFTTLMQQDVERRSQDLLEALENERKRREQEKKDKQQQKEQGQNKFNPQREKLVGLIAELEMLKRLQQDTGRATEDQRVLIESRGDETITETEVALVERLSHRHAEISKIFAQIKAGIEETLGAMNGEEGHDETNPGGEKKGK